jgi:hypothetical protein
MKYRKLRIAWSAVCGVLCLLLIVLWVRSHFLYDHLIVYDIDARGDVLVFRSHLGVLNIGHHNERGGAITRFDWRLETGKLDFRLDSYPPVFRVMDMYNEIEFRYWFLVVISGIFAALPWLRWHFSLRTLLIAITIIGLVLGLIIATTR